MTPEERACILRKPRTNSMGKFREERPRKPNRVDIHGGCIFDDEAKKTIIAIIREYWPVGSYTYTDIMAKHPGWMNDVLKEFKFFYKHLRGQSRFEAKYSIKEHVKKTCKRTMNEEKDRLKIKMTETGASAEDCRPTYFHPLLWEDLLKYWESDSHKHRSTVGRQNRKRVKTLHSAGAKSFDAIEMEMTKENKGKKPKRLKLWDRTHTTAALRKALEARKGKKGVKLVYTSPEAMEIVVMIEGDVILWLLQTLLGLQDKQFVGNACWIISNITAGKEKHTRAVIDSGLIDLVFGVVQNYKLLDVKKEAAWAISNAMYGLSSDQAFRNSCVEPLWNMMKVFRADQQIISFCLEGLVISEGVQVIYNGQPINASELKKHLGTLRGGLFQSELKEPRYDVDNKNFEVGVAFHVTRTVKGDAQRIDMEIRMFYKSSEEDSLNIVDQMEVDEPSENLFILL